MSEGDSAAVERIIANTINETARGDPDALAARIVVALAEAGYRIVAASGRGDTALGPQRAKTQQLYRSPNGDTWFFARDPETGSAFVRHQANAPSGGQVTSRSRSRPLLHLLLFPEKFVDFRLQFSDPALLSLCGRLPVLDKGSD